MENTFNLLTKILETINKPFLGPDELMMDELGYDAGRNQPTETNMGRPLLMASDNLKKVWKRGFDRGTEDRKKQKENDFESTD